MDNLNHNDPVIKYGLIKKQIKDLEIEADMLKPIVMPLISEMRGDTENPVVVPDLGSYTIQIRTTYKYSDEVNEKKKELDKLKKNEVREGIAEVETENTILVFTTEKE